MTRPHLAILLTTLAVVALAGCENVQRPNRPLPEFKASRLDGTPLDRGSLRGKPWLVNLWVPG